MVHVESNEAGLEQRFSSLQAQIDGLRQAASDDARPLEQRLSSLTEYSTGILKRWDATAERHARAVSQLEAHLRELGDTGTRLQQDASQRLQDLERIVQQEWHALRDIHQAPVRQLVEQAANLTEVCIATANSAQHGFDRAEARLASLEADFHRTTAELTREVQALVGEVRQLSAAGPRQLATDTPSWPLEGVTRLHHQLRESAGGSVALVAPTPQPPARLTSPEPASTEADQPVPELAREPARTGLFSHPIVTAVLVILIVASATYAWRLQRDLRLTAERADQSLIESQRAAAAAAREAADRQAADARQLAAARDLAARAQTISDVLAAPDLIRYTLASPGVLPAATGQVLLSRSRGFVFSASGLPAPPADATYQIWLLTRGGAVSAATFVPDTAGSVTVTATPNIPRPLFGAIVTTERKGGADTPSGQPVLARLPVAPTPS